ncbi:hypothetical protein [Desulfobulbus elongatus]|uniref:hypothetical protein n=1 Tax=Desulfobulbus elongatus TaxID=53332 RepID=UPI0012FC1F14|nr:hypothetical protein [Desulfobulbus elongatus]
MANSSGTETGKVAPYVLKMDRCCKFKNTFYILCSVFVDGVTHPFPQPTGTVLGGKTGIMRVFSGELAVAPFMLSTPYPFSMRMEPWH